jgi:hypothetical protein
MAEIDDLARLVYSNRVEVEVDLFAKHIETLLDFEKKHRDTWKSTDEECQALDLLEDVLDYPMGKRVVNDDELQAKVHELLDLIY